METVLYIILLVQLIVFGFQVILLYKLTHVIRKSGNGFAFDGMVIKSIIDDFSSRIKQRDEKIAELMVRLEIIEEKLKHFSTEPQPIKTDKGVFLAKRMVPSHDVVKLILNSLKKGPMTSVEIQKIIGKSREHTARLMKSLYDQGFVDRDTSKKPFRYMLTEKGEKELSSF